MGRSAGCRIVGSGFNGAWKAGVKHRLDQSAETRKPWPAMSDDQHRFLMLLGRPPARWTVEQTAWALNCQPHDVPTLVAAKLLKPLGNPPPNSVKFFAPLEVLELIKDRTWLAKVTNALHQNWQKKNAAKKNLPPGSKREQLRNSVPGFRPSLALAPESKLGASVPPTMIGDSP